MFIISGIASWVRDWFERSPAEPETTPPALIPADDVPRLQAMAVAVSKRLGTVVRVRPSGSGYVFTADGIDAVAEVTTDQVRNTGDANALASRIADVLV